MFSVKFFYTSIVVTALLFFSYALSAQEISINIIEEANYKPNQYGYNMGSLKWSNFKGIIPENEQAFSALTSTRFSYQISQRGTSKKQTITIRPKFFFDEITSKKKISAQNEYILNHEQRHFDIAFYWYTKFLQEIKKLKADNNTIELVARLYKEHSNYTKQMQTMYDDETDHSRVQQKQAEWDTKIDALLAEIKN
jgi:FtsZ-binding cell division protein ZapB